MDVQSPIIVEHGYCSQEIVNLLVCGKASSNVHDGVLSHGSMDLKGLVVPSYHPSIADRAGAKLVVGFLSALEPKGMLEVGSLGKDPALPVWIIYNESHYTVAWLPRDAVSYTHLRAHETPEHLVCRLLLEKKKKNIQNISDMFTSQYKKKYCRMQIYDMIY
eukprot:TRINITY_DN49477_c0_g1_i1.p1 TRINITY_DN49477_c0_g1~~TRINITY_DN49477_c0_g1_i1.p1  ORF type:complete len:162 (+),score=33.27 TRINITY_DN49477_c0_g1_i1:321-806(+)